MTLKAYLEAETIAEQLNDMLKQHPILPTRMDYRQLIEWTTFIKTVRNLLEILEYQLEIAREFMSVPMTEEEKPKHNRRRGQ